VWVLAPLRSRRTPPLFMYCQGSFRVGIDEYVKQREARVIERLEGGDAPSDGFGSSPDLSPTRMLTYVAACRGRSCGV
jgi:hypothetical protein